MRTLNQSRPIGQNEYKKLLRACKNKNLQKAMMLLYYCGFRVNEVKNISISQIENIVQTGELDIYISKQQIKRVVYFSTKSIQELICHLTNSNGKYFLNYKGDSLRVLLNKHIKTVLGAGYTSHGFRRGFITNIINKTNNPKLAQHVIGHRNLQTTLHYDAPNSQDIKKAYEFLE
jgi:integrase